MPVLLATDVQPVGVGELVGVAVRRTHDAHQLLPATDGDTPDLHVGQHRPAGELDRAVVPEQLFHRGSKHARPVDPSPEPFPLVPVPEQCQHAVRDEVHGGLVSRHQQQDAGREELLLVQPLTLLLGCDQPGQQVAPRVGPAGCHQLAEVLAQGHAGRFGFVHDREVHDRVERQDDVGRPPAEPVLILGRDPEHLADDDDRQRVGEVGDQVELPRPALLDPVEQAVDDLVDVRPHRFDHAGREGLADDAPQPVVVRRVEEEHRTRLVPLEEPFGAALHLPELLEQVALARVAAEPLRVLEDRLTVCVAGEDPDAGHQSGMDGLEPAEPLVLRIGIGMDLGEERVELEHVQAHARLTMRVYEPSHDGLRRARISNRGSATPLRTAAPARASYRARAPGRPACRREARTAGRATS